MDKSGSAVPTRRTRKGEAESFRILHPGRRISLLHHDQLHRNHPLEEQTVRTARKEWRTNRDVNRPGPGVSERSRASTYPGMVTDGRTGPSRPSGRGGEGSVEKNVPRLITNTVLTTQTLVSAVRLRTLNVPAGQCCSLWRAVRPCVSVDSVVAGGLAALFFLPSLPSATTFLLCSPQEAAAASITLQPGRAYEGRSLADDAFPLSYPQQLLAEPEGAAGPRLSALLVFTLLTVDLATREQTRGRAVWQGRAPPCHWVP